MEGYGFVWMCIDFVWIFMDLHGFIHVCVWICIDVYGSVLFLYGFVWICRDMFPKYAAKHKGLLPSLKNCFKSPSAAGRCRLQLSHAQPRATGAIPHPVFPELFLRFSLAFLPSRWQVTLCRGPPVHSRRCILPAFWLLAPSPNPFGFP